MRIEFKNDGKRCKISGVAYSGNSIRQPWSDSRIVVDLSGMEFARQIPLMNQHWNDTSNRLGEVTCRVENGVLYIEGEITSDSELARQIIADGQKTDWQLSIGADVYERKIVHEGTLECNARTYPAPVVQVTRSYLREVSVVAIGADSDATMKINAAYEKYGEKPDCDAYAELTLADAYKLKESDPGIIEGNKERIDRLEQRMNKLEDIGNINKNQNTTGEKMSETPKNADVVNATAENTVDITKVADEAVKAERQRVSAIKAVCNGEFAEIEAKAISEGWDKAQTIEAVLEAERKKRPVAPVPSNGKKQNMDSIKAMECSIVMQMGYNADGLVKEYGEETVEAAEKDMNVGIRDVVIALANQNGCYTHGITNDAIRAAFSTVSLPALLSNIANKSVMRGFKSIAPIAPFLCTSATLKDFKEYTRVSLTDAGNLELISDGGEIKHGGLKESYAKNKLDTYGKMLSLTRQMIINDDLNQFTKIPTEMGKRAARLVDQLFFKRLLANPTFGDGKALFSNDHKNLITGATSALSKKSLEAAIAKFMKQVDEDNQPIGIKPKYLLVPVGLESYAEELLRGQVLVVAGTTDVERPAYNSLSNKGIQVISSPYLDNNEYTGSSETAWYLFGDPAEIETFEIGYLNGKRTPTVEQGETDFNTLGMQFRVYFDIGIREQEYRGIVKANGAA